MKNCISKKIDARKHIIFLQISLITGLIEVTCILISASAFNLVKYVIFIEVNKEHSASQRYVVGKERGVLIYLSGSWEHSSLLPKPNLKEIVS